MITDEQIGFKAGDLDQITALLHKYPSVQRAVLFGSRARGNYKHGSDVDIALFIDPAEDIAVTIRCELNDELLLPYKFDVLDYHQIKNSNLRDNINLTGLVMYDKTEYIPPIRIKTS